MRYPFSADFVREWFPKIDGVAFDLPTQSPTIYYFQSQPTREEALAGTGAVQTVSAWTASSAEPYKRSWTVTAITDTDTESATDYEEIWEAILYVNKAAGQTQLHLRQFELTRVTGNDSEPGTSVADIKAVYPRITNYISDALLEESLDVAQEQMRLDFKGKGLNWNQLFNLQDTKLALAYKAIATSCFGQMVAPGDRHDRRFEVFSELYADALNNLSLGYDSNKDGKPDGAVKAKSLIINLLR